MLIIQQLGSEQSVAYPSWFIGTLFPYICFTCTGKSLSEPLIFASTNPQYDDRLFIELQVQYRKIRGSDKDLPVQVR